MDPFSLLTRGARFDRQKNEKEMHIFSTGEKQKRSSTAKVDFFGGQTKKEKEQEQAEEIEENTHSTSEKEFKKVGKSEEEIKNFRKNAKIKVYSDDSVVAPIASFEELYHNFKIPQNVKDCLPKFNIDEPSAVQMQSIPIILEGKDLIACAPTGSGKTLAFSIPLAAKLKKHMKKGFRALIISPTRELAQQIYLTLKILCGGSFLNICLLKKDIIAGMKSSQSMNYDVLISTPLRLVSAVKDKIIDLSNIRMIVFDEADKLMELGFLEQVDEVLAGCTHPKLQKALFSATINSTVETLANSFMREPIRVVIGQKNAATEAIEQKLIYVANEDGKTIAFKQLIREGIKPPVLVFVDSVEKAKTLFHELVYEGIHVDMISSDRTQSQRDQIISNFRLGKIWVLIATDLLARGMDFKGINCVINYDFPRSVASYIHRIGRTGRAGQTGKAITFFTNDDVEHLRSVATVMRDSGCDVPEWMLALKKSRKHRKRAKTSENS